MKVMVSGGTGFIGGRLLKRLREERHDAVAFGRTLPADGVDGSDAIVHLAGETVAQRWTDEVRQRIRDSRVRGTHELVDRIARSKQRPSVLVCASAIGFYGNRGDEVLTEASAPGNGFLVDVCREWEAEADRAEQFGVRVVKLRIGFVLGQGGGALGQMLLPFRMGVGGRLGSGRQWMPWIHIDDVVSLFMRGLQDEGVSGVWNATSPNPVRNSEFTAELGKAVHRPAIFPVPAFALKLVFGEFGEHMLDSSRVVPQRAEAAGFRFQYADVGAALRNLTA